MDALFSDILSNFWLDSAPVSCGPFGCGHVNKTYLVVTKTSHRYIMQMIGPAFKDVHALQDNIRAVTDHLHRKTREKYGGSLSRQHRSHLARIRVYRERHLPGNPGNAHGLL